MTKIKNKQTGETLTGEISQETLNYFAFRIAGTSCPTNPFSCLRAEWEILPPPLPTGIGAVAQAADGIWVRTDNDSRCWRNYKTGCWHSAAEMLHPVAILSEGVNLPGSPE